MNKINVFDVIVIGGGHSGTEASYVSSRIGCKTLLITNNIDYIGHMSCNPSIGGIGKSHLVKEIDALDGLMGIAADRSGIQFRKLNTSKGPAVQSTRVQADRFIYQKEVKKILFKNKNLHVIQQKVIKLLINNNKINGVVTDSKLKFFSNYIVLSLGTFLNGKIYIGLNFNSKGGRYGDISSTYLSKQLNEIFPLSINRLKTGTPPRLDSRSINYYRLEKQYSNFPLPKFSFINQNKYIKQVPCYITYTNVNTHDIIRNNINKSPVYTDIITGKGPRYCPSIEDKVIKFSEKKSHHIFLEPESLYSNEIYPNGISTSLPINIQIKIINSIKGLEKCYITRPGYAVEYDFLDPKNLKPTLESKIISGLFISGQLNGTTGYEEAAAQGLISGLNAALSFKSKEGWCPKRNESYIGVMINDLCNKGVNEPYRMFTSRSEHRLLLREDNADIRLTEIGFKLGIVSKLRWKIFINKREKILKEKKRFKKIIIYPNNKDIEKLKLSIPIKKKISGYEILKHKEVNYLDIINIKIFNPIYDDINIYKIIETDIKYENYINKQYKEIEIIDKYINLKIPENIDFNIISGLSNESINILNKYKPNNLNEIINIPGITPSCIFRLIIWIRKNNNKIN